MAELRCPKCGKKNPDVLEVCQFCQTPLKRDSVLHIGQTPVKKNTGELEAVLPDWLKDVRQQARDSAEEDAAQPKVEKEEPPDLLAGLASQGGSAGDEEIPDWLASINPAASPKPMTPPAGTMPSTPPSPESDFFAQFNQREAKPASEPERPNIPASPEPAGDQAPAPTEEDDLSKWFARASEQPEEIVEIGSDSQLPGEAPWARNIDSSLPPKQEPAPKEEEDLGWLHNLEEAAKQTGDLQAPKQDTGWMANFEAPSSPSESSHSQEDLSWLNNLGGIEESSPQMPAQSSATGEDLSWLNDLGAGSEPQSFDITPDKPTSAPPFAAGEDLSWLSNLGEVSRPSQPAEAAPISSAPEDLSWLNDLGEGSGQQSTPPFIESEWAAQETSDQMAFPGKQEEVEPDWLKSAKEIPSMPPPGDVSLDWFANQDQSAEEKTIPPVGKTPAAPQPPPLSDVFSAPSEPSSLSSQDVDSLFSVEMPDWLSRAEPVTEGHAPQEAALPPAGGEESLAPVELPSWVQAMRPVEAVISETTPGAEEEPEEKEGPLAGLRGVIPGAAVGSSMRPKPVSLKLQATNEQQASAALLEKILESETNPRALILSSYVASQRILRWVLTSLFLIVLSAVIFSQLQIMQVYPALTIDERTAAAAIASVPADAKVLVVIDYEPSLAGELEAVGGPVLDHLTLPRKLQLSFVSMSPNGSALVERLISNTHISQPGVEYRNLGFLPGGSAGVLGFVEGPEGIIPASGVDKFAKYAMVILMTDHAESGRIWVEQLYAQKQIDLQLADQPFVVIASAQAGPLLQPYVSSGQVTGMVSGISEAARYEGMNSNRPGIAHSYLDAFGIGLTMAVVLIVVGSLWSLIAGIRARRAEAEQG